MDGVEKEPTPDAGIPVFVPDVPVPLVEEVLERGYGVDNEATVEALKLAVDEIPVLEMGAVPVDLIGVPEVAFARVEPVANDAEPVVVSLREVGFPVSGILPELVGVVEVFPAVYGGDDITGNAEVPEVIPVPLRIAVVFDDTVDDGVLLGTEEISEACGVVPNVVVPDAKLPTDGPLGLGVNWLELDNGYGVDIDPGDGVPGGDSDDLVVMMEVPEVDPESVELASEEDSEDAGADIVDAPVPGVEALEAGGIGKTVALAKGGWLEENIELGPPVPWLDPVEMAVTFVRVDDDKAEVPLSGDAEVSTAPGVLVPFGSNVVRDPGTVLEATILENPVVLSIPPVVGETELLERGYGVGAEPLCAEGGGELSAPVVNGILW